MELRRAPLRHASPPVHPARTAGIITLVGSSCAILGGLLPWLVRTALGISLTTAEFQVGTVLGTVLAVISAGIATVVLLRRPASEAMAILLILLALTQIGVATWDGLQILKSIAQVSSHQVWASAIGTGLYASLLGSAVTLAGGIVAWTRRASPGDAQPAGDIEVPRR